jgi:hypothetical protein
MGRVIHIQYAFMVVYPSCEVPSVLPSPLVYPLQATRRTAMWTAKEYKRSLNALTEVAHAADIGVQRSPHLCAGWQELVVLGEGKGPQITDRHRGCPVSLACEDRDCL